MKVNLLAICPDLHATLLDLPDTLEVARELCRDDPAASRLHLRAANYLEDAYGEGLDLVLLSHVTHDESPQAVRSMLQRAHDALSLRHLVRCDNCNEYKPAHEVCPHCGTYKGQQVIELDEE